MGCVRTMLREEGVAGFFSGWKANRLHVHSSPEFTVYKIVFFESGYLLRRGITDGLATYCVWGIFHSLKDLLLNCCIPYFCFRLRLGG